MLRLVAKLCDADNNRLARVRYYHYFWSIFWCNLFIGVSWLVPGDSICNVDQIVQSVILGKFYTQVLVKVLGAGNGLELIAEYEICILNHLECLILVVLVDELSCEVEAENLVVMVRELGHLEQCFVVGGNEESCGIEHMCVIHVLFLQELVHVRYRVLFVCIKNSDACTIDIDDGHGTGAGHCFGVLMDVVGQTVLVQLFHY